MKKNIFLVLALLFVGRGGSLFAQSYGILKGVVKDASGGGIIIGAIVFDPADKAHGVATDINGGYQLHLSPGKHTVVCSVIGMKSDSIVVVSEASKTTEHNFVLESASTLLGTVVVSAGKYERKLEEITVSMDVIKPNLIENKNASNIKGVLEHVPGLNILDGEPQIRGGSGFNFGVGSRVAILIDGLPALAGDGSALQWNFIPLENVEQIEVIKGASSVTYGSSALSGSVNVRTAYAKEEPITKVSLSSGIYDAPPIDSSKWWKGIANFSTFSFMHAEKKGQLDLVVGAMAIYDHGFIGPSNPHHFPSNSTTNINDTAIGENQVGEHTARFNFNLRYRPKKISQLNYGVNGNFMKSSNNLSLIWDNDSSGLYRAFPFTMTLQEQSMFYLDPFISYFSKNGFTQSLRTRYSYTKNVATSYTTTDLSTETKVIYSEYQAIKKINEGLNVTGGIIMNQAYSHSGLPFHGVLPDNHFQNYAGYAQVDKKLWSIVNLSLGYRDEFFKMNDQETVSKSIFRSGINVKLAQATFFRASYGQGYRFPSIKEKYIHSDIGGQAIFPNPDLLPESSSNAEFGIKQGFKINNFTGYIDFAYFNQLYENTIEITYGLWYIEKDVVGNDSLLAGFKYLNTGKTRVQGIEVSIPGEGKISKDLKIEVLADYTYVLPQALHPSYVFATDTFANQMTYLFASTDPRNNILKYRFEHLVKADLQVTYKKFSIGGDWRYYSFIQNIDMIFYFFDPQADYGIKTYRQEHGKDINIFDSRVAMQVTKSFKAAFMVNNMFNKSYSLRPLKIESQRTFALRLSLNL